jgi:hypothetical protein
LKKLWVTILKFGKIVGYSNGGWKNYGLLKRHLGKLWVPIRVFVKTTG